MSLWQRHVTIARVHGYAVAGGSDIAMCCDLIVMAQDAKIGPCRPRGVGLPDHRDVDLPADARQAADVHRRHAGRQHRAEWGW